MGRNASVSQILGEPKVNRYHNWQFCTTGPGGIGVGYEWDGSQLDHPNPRPTTLAFFGHINTSVPKINF